MYGLTKPTYTIPTRNLRANNSRSGAASSNQIASIMIEEWVEVEVEGGCAFWAQKT